MGSIVKRGFHQYLLQLQQNPLRTKVITAGVLAAITDIVAQKIVGVPKIQLRRLVLKVVDGKNEAINCYVFYAILGLAKLPVVSHPKEILTRATGSRCLKIAPWEGPDMRIWLFPRIFVLLGAGYLGPFGHYFHILLEKIFKGKKDTKTVAKKVVVEQLTASPWNNLFVLFYYGIVVEGKPWTHVKAKMKREYPTVQYTSWSFWPVVGWINHQYIPLQFRVIFHSVVACFWGIFLTLRAMTLSKG